MCMAGAVPVSHRLPFTRQRGCSYRADLMASQVGAAASGCRCQRRQIASRAPTGKIWRRQERMSANVRNVVISIAVAMLFLYLAFRNVPLADLQTALQRFDLIWLIPAVAISLALQVFRVLAKVHWSGKLFIQPQL